MEQTNRTILFEEINPQKGSLLTFINQVEKKESLTDEEIAKIHKTLEVSSFEDFIQKFEPSVNMLLDTERFQVAFLQDDSTGETEKIRLDTRESLFSMLISLIEAKQKKKYLLTAFSDMLDNMIPREDTTLFLDERNRIFREENRQPEGIKNLIMKSDDGLFLLTAFLKDVSHLLTMEEVSVKADKGILDDKGNMQIRVIKKSKKYKKTGFLCENVTMQDYECLIEQCFREIAQERKLKNPTLLKNCLLIPVFFFKKEYGRLQQMYEEYSQFYIEILKKFWITAKPMIETMLGVREFFGQDADIQGMKPQLVVCNFKIGDLLQHKNREKLQIYLNTVNAKSFYQNTIWYAILPNLSGTDRNEQHVVRERFLSKKKQYQYYSNQPEEVALLLELLAEHRIQSFLSMSLTNEYTFAAFVKNGVDGINSALRPLEKLEGKDYCIPCFPNFTVISQEEACICVGKELLFDDLSEKVVVNGDKRLWLDEIGIEAAYVAAGLVAACQNPEYLKKRYRQGVNDLLPGVGYRFSEEDHNAITTSAMLSETIEYAEELEQDAINSSRGILFGQKNGKMVVLTDRVFSYSYSNPLLISMVQTMNYIERRIQHETQDFKKNLISQFFQRRPGSIISQWYNNGDKNINPVLREEEDLEYKIDDSDNQCTFTIRFQNNSLIKSKTVSIFKE